MDSTKKIQTDKINIPHQFVVTWENNTWATAITPPSFDNAVSKKQTSNSEKQVNGFIRDVFWTVTAAKNIKNWNIMINTGTHHY